MTSDWGKSYTADKVGWNPAHRITQYEPIQNSSETQIFKAFQENYLLFGIFGSLIAI